MGTIDYIPRKDALFRDWAYNFVHQITKDCARYMLVKADVDSITVLFDQFEAAFRRASAPDTRTTPSIIAKQDARHSLQHLLRLYARQIKSNEGIDDADKIAIGVPPINVARNKRKVPQVSPELNIVGQTPGVDHLRVTKSTSDSSAKPYGAERLEVFAVYTEKGDPPPRIEDAKYLGSFRRAKITIEHDPSVGEKRATYWARWAGFNDDVGPWSLPVSFSLAKQEKEKKDAEAKAGKKADTADEQKAMKIAA